MTAFAAMGGFLFLNTLYLQDVRGFSPLAAGLYLRSAERITGGVVRAERG